MKLLGKDETGRNYHWAQYKPGCLENLPWGKAVFDVGLFVNPSVPKEEVETTIRELLRCNCDWISVFGATAEYWHDRVDQISVEMGRQKNVGEGSPMTAFFEEVTNPENLDISHFFGAYDVFILLQGFTAEEAIQVERFGERLGI